MIKVWKGDPNDPSDDRVVMYNEKGTSWIPFPGIKGFSDKKYYTNRNGTTIVEVITKDGSYSVEITPNGFFRIK